jgi:hypothetical protein
MTNYKIYSTKMLFTTWISLKRKFHRGRAKNLKKCLNDLKVLFARAGLNCPSTVGLTRILARVLEKPITLRDITRRARQYSREDILSALEELERQGKVQRVVRTNSRQREVTEWVGIGPIQSVDFKLLKALMADFENQIGLWWDGNTVHFRELEIEVDIANKLKQPAPEEEEMD